MEKRLRERVRRQKQLDKEHRKQQREIQRRNPEAVKPVEQAERTEDTEQHPEAAV